MIVPAANTLGASLLDGLGTDPSRTLLVSPYSLASCLALALNGAAGRTRAALATAVGGETLAEDDVNRRFRDLRSQLLQTDGQTVTELATALWGPAGAAFDAEFVRRVQHSYGAEVRAVDSGGPAGADLINRWVTDRTRGRITHLVEAGDLSADLTCVLTDAVYFKGPWGVPFDPRSTRVRSFALPDGRSRDLPMMTRSGRHAYVETDEWQAVALDYASGRLGMHVLLPRPGTALTSSVWARLAPRFEDAMVTLSLPRFSVTCELDLVPALSELGLRRVFEPMADFSRMGPAGSFISAWRHSARVDVTEEGTEAAAGTAVVMGRSLVPAVEMTVDRPFLCAIVDNRSGMLLFLGRVTDPLAPSDDSSGGASSPA